MNNNKNSYCAFCIKTDEGFYAKDGYFTTSFIDAQLFQRKQIAELPANQLNDLHVKDNWRHDLKATFAFNKGVEYAEKKFKEQIEYLVYGISCEKEKKDRLIEILHDNNFSVTDFLDTLCVINLNNLDN